MIPCVLLLTTNLQTYAWSGCTYSAITPDFLKKCYGHCMVRDGWQVAVASHWDYSSKYWTRNHVWLYVVEYVQLWIFSSRRLWYHAYCFLRLIYKPTLDQAVLIQQQNYFQKQCSVLSLARKVGHTWQHHETDQAQQELISRWDSECELLRSVPGSYPNSMK